MCPASSPAPQPSGPAAIDTRDPAEIARFNALAERWWDASGPMGVLHKFNPARVAYIRDRVAERFGRDALSGQPLQGLSLVDIGCGGGILAEPLARMGASVTGLDPARTNIAVARRHAAMMELEIDYRENTIEDVVAAGERFDIVLAMEVVEHVADVPGFVATCAQAVKPGGMLVMATLNRTLKSFALAIVGAEYVLRWLPRGTHEWNRFLRPEELSGMIASAGLDPLAQAGVVYRPLADEWALSQDMDVNYMLVAGRAG